MTTDQAALDRKVLRLDAGLHTITARELQGMEFAPIAYVVPGYVCEGLTLLAGKPKLGKSWLALDWGLAVAYGGIASGSIQCEPGDVLYCALEDNQRRLKRRLRQLLPTQDLPDRLELLTEMPRLHQGGLDVIQRWARVAERPRLVIIDTLAQVRPPRGAKDSIYDSDYAALGPLQRLAGSLGIAVIVVTHLRKMEADDPMDTVSGSTGLTGAADTVLVLSRDGQGVTLYGRGRDIDEIETAMSFDKTLGRWSVLGEAAVVRSSDERRAVLDELEGVEGGMAIADLAAVTGIPRKNLEPLIYKMVKAGQLAHGKRGYVGTPGKIGKMARNGTGNGAYA